MSIKTGQDLASGPGEESGVQVRRLSFAQEQLWFLDQLAPGETSYNILMAWRLRGPLRLDLLQRCLTLVVARHESLRVTIGNDEGTPYQVVAPAAEVALTVTDLRALPKDQREQRVLAEMDAQRGEPYDLETGPLYRFRVLLLDTEDYVFFQDFHHIVTDGWSAGVTNSELSTAYRSLYSGTEPVFEDTELEYTDFAEEQRERLQGDVLAEELSFWQQRLAGLPVLELPTDRPYPVGGSYQGQTLNQDLPEDLRGIVQQLAEDHGVSMFMVIATAYNLVLSRYSGLEDIAIGVPMLGRPEPELEAVVGMFINMVVLRSDLSGDPSFSELIDRVADGFLELFEHQEVPFNQVVDAVQPVRDPARNPLFQVSLQLLGESNSGQSLSFPDVVAEYLPVASRSSRFDIGINLVDTGSLLRASVEYSSEMFDSWRIQAMLGHLETVLRAAAADSSMRLSQIPIVAGAEAEQLLSAGRGEVAGYPQQKAGQQVYVVDRWLNLVPRGVAGELLVSGEPGSLGLSDPGQPERAAEQFIDDPFQPGRLVYRSGELVRWNRDLQLEFLGRLDNQMRLRGLQLALGTIEAALASHPDVERAVVLARPDLNGEKRLIAYLTAAAGHQPTEEELRAHLSSTLPDYLIPAAWVMLEEFPFNGGKIDYAALPDPVEPGTEDGNDDLRTPTEQTVADIFGGVLSLPTVGAEESFFEIGGNSLQAMRAVSRINKKFGIKLSVKMLYGNVTVRAVSVAVDERVGAKSE